MSWSWYSQLSDAFKRRAGRYLINRYLGPFLEEGILLNQLSVDGPIRLRDVALNTANINSMLEESEAPVEFVDGYIQELSVTVPWSNLLKENCYFEIHGLTITLQVKKRAHPSQLSASIFHSMCESFSSMDVAEDCLRQNEVTDSPSKAPPAASSDTTASDTVLGVEVLAQAIDSIIMRVQVLLLDTTIRIEYVPTVAPRGLAMEVKVGKLRYSGEIPPESDAHKPSGFTTSTLKKIFFEDVSLLTDEFSFKKDDPHASALGLSSHYEAQMSCDDRQPLLLGRLTGVQELVVKFTDINHYGLPRSIEEVELNLGGAVLHAYPHQVHCLLEIVSSFTVPPVVTDDDTTMGNMSMSAVAPEHRLGLENMLQESMILKPVGLASETGWSTGSGVDVTSRSTEFQPMPRIRRATMDSSGAAGGTSDSNLTPTIIVKATSVIGVFLERDEAVTRMGGEATKSLAIDKMLATAAKFFSIEPPSVSGIWDKHRQRAFHNLLSEYCAASHIQLVGAPLSLTYEEGCPDGSAFSSSFLMRLSLTVGRCSIKEYISTEEASHEAVIDVIAFDGSNSASSPDFKLTYEDVPDDCDEAEAGGRLNKGRGPVKSNISIALNACTVNFDPGFVDRIYTLMYYSEMDPSCLVSPANETGDEAPVPKLSLNIASPHVCLNFYVPKVDMRKPKDIPTAELVMAFWSRNVHQELYQLRLKQLDVTLSRDADLLAPLTVTLTSDLIDILFQETSASEILPLCVVRRSDRNAGQPNKRAGRVSVTVCMDDSLKLQGKYNSAEVPSKMRSFEAADDYFGGAAGGDVHVGGSGRDSRLVEEQQNIRAALEHGLRHNNLFVDLHFDEVSFVLPSKHVYEVIYNRLGNDMLLWLPAIFTIKDVLYNQPLPDPLRDPDLEFSRCYSGTKPMLSYDASSPTDEANITTSIYGSFPRSKSPAVFIHTDTCVSLSLNKGYVTICSPISNPADPDDMVDYLFLGIVDKIKLMTVVGLEKDPEICLLSLTAQNGRVSFGPTSAGSSHLPPVDRLHFNEVPSNRLSVLLQRTDFKTRAWQDSLDANPLVQLTAKILFDSKTNFKTINLGMLLSEASLLSNVSTPPVLIDWLAEFFTVVEYPVTGYIPPAILTEMHFDVQHCTVDMTHIDPGKLTLALGRIKINCSLLDTGTDVSISLTAEDVALYMSSMDMCTRQDHLASSVCICDIDSLDLSVTLRERPPAPPLLDVSAACNLVRLRTCSDTIAIITSIVNSIMAANESKASSREPSVPRDSEGKKVPDDQQQVNEDVIPDLADAMAELIEEEAAVATSPQKKDVKGVGAQVFFFPDEGNRLPSGLGMTESFYAAIDQPPTVSPNLDDSFDDFCILDDVGSGFGERPSEALVRVLDPSGSVALFENHFAPVADKSIDYLKTPKGFPVFQSRITLRQLSVLWQIYGGSDFSPRTTFSVGIQSGQSPAAAQAQQLNNTPDGLKTRGGPGRNADQLLEVFISKVSGQHEIYPEDSRQASRQILIVNSFEIRDKLASSDINKLLHLYSNKLRPRQTNANMFCIKCVNVRPDPEAPLSEESIINVTLQPLRINIDQETLFFLIDFFSTFGPGGQLGLVDKEPVVRPVSTDQQQTCAIRYSHGMDVVEIQPEVAQEAGEDLFVQEEGFKQATLVHVEDQYVPANNEESLYIRSFVFSRDVPIRIDYTAKYVDFTQGAITGLLAGLTSLNCSELTLKKVCYRNGIVGVDKLLMLLVTEWLADIRQNQIPNILGGVGPMHSLLQLIQGIKDLFMLPVEQYQKDGRLLRGIQKGAHSFTSSTAMSLLDFTNKVLGVIKFAAEMAFDIMSPESCVVQGKLPHPNLNRRAVAIRRPADMREGVFNALAVIQEGVEETARTVMQTVVEDHARRGISGAVGGILRQVPPNLVRPVILATTATSNVLEGVKSQVAPESRREEEDKWKGAQNSS